MATASYDRQTVFADRMMFPEGAMWFEGSLYVAAPPQHLEADRHRRRRRRRPARGVVRGQDAHRLRQRPARPLPRPRRLDLLVQGGVRRADLRAAGRSPPSSPAPRHIFRAKADGTEIEPVMTGGMDNPVDVVFTPGGEPIFTTTFLQSPAGGKRDGLIHAVYGGVYGKANGVLDGHTRTGARPDARPDPPRPRRPLRADALRVGRLRPGLPGQPLRLPVQHAEGVAARADPRGFDASGRSTATSSSRLDHDFHPTDVIEDADGSLLVDRHGRLVQALLPDVATGEARRPRGDLPDQEVGSGEGRRPAGTPLDWEKPGIDDLCGQARRRPPCRSCAGRPRRSPGRCPRRAFAPVSVCVSSPTPSVGPVPR